MEMRRQKRATLSSAFSYAIIALGISTGYVYLSIYLESRLGIQHAQTYIFQTSPVLFGTLGFVIGFKQDQYRDANARASTDFLTGLWNHSHFQEHLRNEISRSTRYQRPVSLLMLDLDHFKNVNDTFGHQKGDQVLRLVGDFLKKESRRIDLAARYGGEEFVILMPEIAGDDAVMCAERLRKRIGTIASEAGIPDQFVSVSTGVSDCPACATDADSLIAVADAALLFAKRKGRNRVAYFRDMHDIELRRDDFCRLSHRLEGASLQSLKALVAAVESFDLYSENGDMEILAGGLADQLGMDSQDRELLILASQLHDVGKVGVPSSIVNKKSQLAPDELALLRQHPEMGQQLLREVAQVRDLFSAILYHHERWDGEGYPEGLKGEEIPRLARVVGVLDAYRAMTSDRPYRAALSRAKAIIELRHGAGSQFDPALVEPFIKLLEGGSAVQAA